MNDWCLYLLENTDNKYTYLGVSNKRRQGKGKTPLDRRNYLINLIVKDKEILFK